MGAFGTVAANSGGRGAWLAEDEGKRTARKVMSVISAKTGFRAAIAERKQLVERDLQSGDFSPECRHLQGVKTRSGEVLRHLDNDRDG